MEKQRPLVITLSRQLGSGGSYLGYLIAKELGCLYVDREILRRAAERLHTDPRALEDLDEKAPGWWEKITQGFSFGIPALALPYPSRIPFDFKELFALEGKIMQEIADRFRAVIVGRGGFYHLKDRPEVIRIFIHAPFEWRVERFMKAQNSTDRKEASARVKESDQNRARILKEAAGVDWTDARNYHLCLDSSLMDFPQLAHLVIEMVKERERGRQD